MILSYDRIFRLLLWPIFAISPLAAYKCCPNTEKHTVKSKHVMFHSSHTSPPKNKIHQISLSNPTDSIYNSYNAAWNTTYGFDYKYSNHGNITRLDVWLHGLLIVIIVLFNVVKCITRPDCNPHWSSSLPVVRRDNISFACYIL